MTGSQSEESGGVLVVTTELIDLIRESFLRKLANEFFQPILDQFGDDEFATIAERLGIFNKVTKEGKGVKDNLKRNFELVEANGERRYEVKSQSLLAKLQPFLHMGCFFSASHPHPWSFFAIRAYQEAYLAANDALPHTVQKPTLPTEVEIIVLHHYHRLAKNYEVDKFDYSIVVEKVNCFVMTLIDICCENHREIPDGWSEANINSLDIQRIADTYYHPVWFLVEKGCEYEWFNV